MEYDTFSAKFLNFMGFIGIFFYLMSLWYLFRLKKRYLILNDKFTLILIHSITNFLDVIITEKYYNKKYPEEGLLIPDLIMFLLSLIQYYILKNQVNQLIFGNKIFDGGINFEFDYFWILHIVFIIIIFPYQIIINDIYYTLQYIKICLLFIFIVTYFILIKHRITEILDLFNEKLESPKTYLVIHIPNIKTIDLYEIYSTMSIILYVNLIIYIFTTILIISINIFKQSDFQSPFIQCLYYFLNEINFFGITFYLIYLLYLFNRKSKQKKLKNEEENIMNIDEEDENEDDEEYENEEEEYEEEEDEENKNKKIHLNSETEKINPKNQNIELQDFQF
jgi:hypothetical protein